jgi:hypothetical protein
MSSDRRVRRSRPAFASPRGAVESCVCRDLPRWTGWVACIGSALCALSIPEMFGGPVDASGFCNAVGWGARSSRPFCADLVHSSRNSARSTRGVIGANASRFENGAYLRLTRSTKSPLDSITTIRRLAAFYVHEHNAVLPHSAFRGQTPDEMCLGTGHAIPADLELRVAAARRARVEANRSASCVTCPSLNAAA